MAVTLILTCVSTIAWGETPERETPEVVEASPQSVRVERNVVYVERPDIKLLADLYYPAASGPPAQADGSSDGAAVAVNDSDEFPRDSGIEDAARAEARAGAEAQLTQDERVASRDQAAVGGAPPAARAGQAHAIGRVPGVLVVHGGAWMSGSKMQVAWHAMRLARRGYFVMAINYRLAPKYQHPAQIEDCRDALKWMHTHADRLGVDANRLGAYGYSAGGHLVCLLGLSAVHPSPDAPLSPEKKSPETNAVAPARDVSPVGSDAGQANDVADARDAAVAVEAADATETAVRLRCVVAGGAPCDFCRLPLDSPQLSFWLGGTRRELPEVYRLASPITYASPKAPPVFLFHGEADHLVPGTGAERLRQSLTEQGVTTHWHAVPNAGHLQTYLDGDAFEEAAKFLDRWLRAEQ